MSSGTSIWRVQIGMQVISFDRQAMKAKLKLFKAILADAQDPDVHQP